MWDQFEDALTYLQDALVICRETGDRRGEGLALATMGRAYQELHQFEDAVTYSQDALALFRNTGDRHNEGLALVTLGFTYASLRRPDQAASCVRAAVEAMRQAGDYELAVELEQAANMEPRTRRWRWRLG